MRALLNVVQVRSFDLALVKTDKDSAGIFGYGRVLVEAAPASMAHLPSGRIPAARQPLAESASIHPFFTDERVIHAAGGLSGLEHWLKHRVKSCQYPHSSYHHQELVTMRHPPGAIRVCWHCDNALREQTTEALSELACENVIAWVIDTVLRELGYNDERMLSVAELCWWVVSNGIGDAITEDLARQSLRLPDDPIPSVWRESDIVPAVPATSILQERVKSAGAVRKRRSNEPLQEVQERRQAPLVTLSVDPEPPASFMKRPKRVRWECAPYLKWVKTQACECCGQTADDPHHLIGHGQGGMGTKAHDAFSIPLCRLHHTELHNDPVKFEQQYGSQTDMIIKVQDRAYALGVLA